MLGAGKLQEENLSLKVWSRRVGHFPNFPSAVWQTFFLVCPPQYVIWKNSNVSLFTGAYKRDTCGWSPLLKRLDKVQNFFLLSPCNVSGQLWNNVSVLWIWPANALIMDQIINTHMTKSSCAEKISACDDPDHELEVMLSLAFIG